MKDLPGDWIRTTLGDVCEIISGGTPKTTVTEYWSGDIPWITPDDLSKDRSQVVSIGARSLTKAGYESCSAKLMPPGSIIYSSRAPIGYVAIAGTELCTNQGCKSVILPAGIDSRYLYWYLKFVTPDIRSRASGTTFKEISGKKFGETELILPPLTRQQRIVADLERYLARLEDSLSSLHRVSDLLSSWRDATLARAFRGMLADEDLSDGDASDLHDRFTAAPVEGPWTLPDKWKWRRIGDLFTVSIGATPSRADASLWGGGIPWVSSGEVAFNRITHTRETISIAALRDAESRIHPPGTVMLAIIGEGKTRGQAAILDISAAHNQNCASIRVSETAVLPEYIFWFLYLRYNENRQVASGGNQPALNKRKVENILVPLAPIEAQRKIVSILENVDEQIARTQAAVREGMKRAQYLKKTIFRTAFSGLLDSKENES